MSDRSDNEQDLTSAPNRNSAEELAELLSAEVQVDAVTDLGDLDCQELAASGLKSERAEPYEIYSKELDNKLSEVSSIVGQLNDLDLNNEQKNLVNRIETSSKDMIALLDCAQYLSLTVNNDNIRNLPVGLTSLIEQICASLNNLTFGSASTIASYCDPLLNSLVVEDTNELQQTVGSLLSVIVGTSIDIADSTNINLRFELNGQNLKISVKVAIEDDHASSIEVLVDEENETEESNLEQRFVRLLPVTCDEVMRLGGAISIRNISATEHQYVVSIPLAYLGVDTNAISDDEAIEEPDLSHEDLAIGIREPDKPERESFRILVAEDSEMNRLIISKQLETLGYLHDVVADGRDAIEKMESNDYALLLTDINMPEMNGYELAQAVRAKETNGHRLPIVALSASVDEAGKNECKRSGIDRIIEKPLRMERLTALIADYEEGTNQSANALLDETSDKSVSYIDTSVLKAIVGDDETTILEFLNEYLKSASKLCNDLDKATKDHDWGQVSKLAHSLKSMSRTVGAKEAGEICARLETAGRELDADIILSDMPRLRDVMRKLIEEIQDQPA